MVYTSVAPAGRLVRRRGERERMVRNSRAANAFFIIIIIIYLGGQRFLRDGTAISRVSGRCFMDYAEL